MASQTRLPTGDWSTLEWTPSTGTTHYTLVDDPDGAPDADSTWVEAYDLDLGESYSYAPFSLPVGVTIDSVVVTANSRITFGSGFLRINAVINGSIVFGPEGPQGISSSYLAYTSTWTTNPDTGLPWTQADVEGTGPNPLGNVFGFYSYNITGSYIRVTQFKITANYTAATGSIATRSAGRRGRRS